MSFTKPQKPAQQVQEKIQAQQALNPAPISQNKNLVKDHNLKNSSTH